MNECNFCNKIYNAQKLKETYWTDRDIVNCITYNEEDNTYNIWHECQDDYYSDEILKINFCPKCGRKINLNYKNLR